MKQGRVASALSLIASCEQIIDRGARAFPSFASAESPWPSWAVEYSIGHAGGDADRDRAMNRRGVRAPLLAFLLRRALFFALIVAGSNVAFVRKAYNDRIWETTVELQRGRIVPQPVMTVMNGDAWFYR